MKVRYKLVDSLVTQLHNDHIIVAPHVDVAEIIEARGIEVVRRDFGSKLSGAAMVEGSRKVISINSSDSPERQRFTEAHELAHLLLHTDKPLSVDVHPVLFFRDERASKGDDWREREANYFAASLLMPDWMLRKEIEERYGEPVLRESHVESLAELFKVSPLAMSIRLGAVGILTAI